MTEEPRLIPFNAGAVRSFLKTNWRSIAGGVLLGAVVGLIAPAAVGAGVKIIGRAIDLIKNLGRGIPAWPRRGSETTFVILSAAALFCVIGIAAFLKKFWLSLRAGLVSGSGFIWFLASALAFVLLNLTGSLRSLLFLGVGAAGAWVLYQRDVKLGKDSEFSPDGDPDEPIATPDKDILNRGTLVATIVRAVVNDRVSIIALTGAFGDGKTSVLNLLSRELDARNDVVSVRFSTWLPMDEKTLVSTLLSTVLAKLETKLYVPKIKRDLTAVTRLFFAVIPRVPTPLMDLVAKPSQDQQISDLRKNLSKLPVRVAVLLDDIDRMRKRELMALFKLLRAVPEFPQFTYVCAFHRDSLTQILSRRSSPMTRGAAERFLEKFFPEEIPLPKIEDARLALEFENRFYEICDQNHLLADSNARQKFRDEFRPIWQMHLKGYFSNLRRLKLFTNRLRRSLPIVGHEVNLRDFVLLETVRMMNPVIYEEIFRNARYFMFAQWRFTSWLQVLHPDEEEEGRLRKRYLDSLFEGMPRPPEGTVLALLEEIFPMVKSYLKGTPARGVPEGPDTANRERRVYHPDFFPRYFIFNVPADLFGEEELSHVVAEMNKGTEVASCVEVFDSTYQKMRDVPMKRWDFLRRVDSSIAKFSPIAIQALAIAISELSGNLEEDEILGSFDNVTALSKSTPRYS